MVMMQADAQFTPTRVGSFGVLAPYNEVDRRLHQLAEQLGVVLVPAWYTATAVGGLAVEQVSITPDALEGPFFVTALRENLLSATSSAGDLELEVQTGSRRLVEGRLRMADFKVAIGDEGWLPAPVVVLRGDTLKFQLTYANGQLSVAGRGITALGWSVRMPDGSRLPSGSLADKLARCARAEGEFYAAGVYNNRQDSVTISSEVLMQSIILGIDNPGVGQLGSNTLRLQIGNLDVFPQGLTLDTVRDPNLLVPPPKTQFAVRYAVPQGQRITLVPSYPAGAAPNGYVPNAVAILGRRKAA